MRLVIQMTRCPLPNEATAGPAFAERAAEQRPCGGYHRVGAGGMFRYRRHRHVGTGSCGAEALGVTREEFLLFLILMACFTLMTVGFGIMGGIGVRAVPLFQPAAPVSSGGSGLGL